MTLVPKPRHNKREIFKKLDAQTRVQKPNFLLIGDSLISNLSLFPKIWNDCFSQQNAKNLGIKGDKTQNVLWRIQNMYWPSTVSSVFILCGTNNINVDTPEDIARGILLCGNSVRNYSTESVINILPLLPRGRGNSLERYKIVAVNKILEMEWKSNKLFFLDISKKEWMYDNNELNLSLYHTDCLHFSEKGIIKLSKIVLDCFIYQSRFKIQNE